jgi:hypothetical protein
MKPVILFATLIVSTAAFAATPRKLEVEVKPAAITVARLQSEISDLNSQIADVEGRIVTARGEELSTRGRTADSGPRQSTIDRAVLASAEARVTSLEMERSALMDQRDRRVVDLTQYNFK